MLACMSDMDNDDFRGWRFDAMSREAQLERRVKELETLVARLEREMRMKNLSFGEMQYKAPMINIGKSHGTIGNVGGPAVPPESPHKAD